MVRNLTRAHFLGELLLLLTITAGMAIVSQAQTTGFTYQGWLTDGGTVANGNYDLQFVLWDSLNGGTQVGSTQTVNTVAVTNGVFTVSLDFGASSFPGASRFLEISARPSGPGTFILLTPRQQVTSTPYAVRSASAGSADTATNSTNATTATNATQLGGVAASQYVQTSDSRLTDSRSPTAGSTNYIQNSTSPQAATNFNISGNGTAAGTLSGLNVNATNQYKINNAPILIQTTGSLFVGLNAGQNTTVIGNDTFVGDSAGQANTSGIRGSFFGVSAGVSNTTGSDNTFFGSSAGTANQTGQENTFIGSFAGANSTADRNTALGYQANVSAGLSNATVIGASAQVTQSNSLVLGSINGSNGATADTSVGIGTAAPTNRLDVNVGTSAAVNSGITIQGKTSGLGDLGLLIKNTGTSGNVWFIDSTSSGSNYGGGKLAFTIEGSATPPLAINSTGTVSVPFLGSSGATAVCRNSANELATCSSSLRYKSNVATFAGGLDIINRLRPISFKWKQDGMPDIGLGAEEVAKVEPLLTFRNAHGEIEGVKYNQLSAVFVNAIKEQQTQIQKQQTRNQEQQRQISQQQLQIKKQQQELDALKKLVCRSHPRAGACK